MVKRNTESGYCTVYPLLLAICYLEVLLWTSCLVFTASAAASGDGCSYLLRETGNLKLAGRNDRYVSALPEFPLLHAAARAQQQEYSGVAQQLQKAFSSPHALLDSALLIELRIPAAESGVPAPFAGIEAIS